MSIFIVNKVELTEEYVIGDTSCFLSTFNILHEKKRISMYFGYLSR